MLGCAVEGMGISMVPRFVLKTFPDVKLLSVHTLPPEFNIAPTVFIRRKGAVSPQLTALIEALTDRTDLNARLTARRKAGSISMQSLPGGQQTISPRAKT